MINVINRHVGQALKELRRQSGKTQEQIASLLSVPQSFVSKVETGERSLKLYEAYAYADALGIDVAELVAAVGEQIAAFGGEE